MRTIKFFLIALGLLTVIIFQNGFAQTTRNVGSGGDYTTLKSAFDAINSGSIKGVITLRITSSTTETGSAILNASGTGSASYTSVSIYPNATGFTISGNLGSSLIDLNGADNVTINGSVNAGGSEKDMTIENTNTTTSAMTIRFLNSAESNNVKYCNIKGSGTSPGNGTITFSSSSSGNGNDNNIVENCDITNAGSRPVNLILTSGSSGRENSGNIIRNNYLYDFFNAANGSCAVNIVSASVDWTISGNSFYETTTFVPTAGNNYNVIKISTASNQTVSGNYIGGSLPSCAGSAWTVNSSLGHYFCGIYVSGGVSTASTVQNNIIKNINYTSTQGNPWDGIYINAGNVNVTGNTIGATEGTGSIVITTPVASATATMSGGVITAVNLVGGGSGYTTAPLITFSISGSTTSATAIAQISGGAVTSVTLNSGGTGYTTAPIVSFGGASYSTSHGMIQNSSGTVNITNNNIGSITTIGSSTTYSHGFEAIYVRTGTGTTSTTISNNIIGSTNTANSIQTGSTGALSPEKLDVYGIYSSGTGTTIISGNTVANLTNAYIGINSASKTRGIQTIAGTNTIQNNTIRNISTASRQISGQSAASLIGISQTSSTAGLNQTVTGNTVYSLSNTNSGDTRNDVYGIYYSGPASGVNTVSGNFVYSLSVSSTSTSSMIEGIDIYYGLTTIANNIINLGVGVTAGCVIYGIFDDNGAANNNNIYFNSLYIGGTVSSGTTSSTSALKNMLNTTTRNYRNNVLFNARTGGTSGYHYAIVLAGKTGLTIDYNDYFVSGATLGRI